MADLIGQRFGLLVVTESLGGGWWRTQCDCGREGTPSRTNTLRCGNTKSCGCYGKRLTPPPPDIEGAKWIPLTRGFFALVDDSDYDAVVAAGPWAAHEGPNTWYARNHGNGYLPRFISLLPRHLEVDHINRNGLDCRQSNLRPATKREQQLNSSHRKQATATSRWKGVYWDRRRKRWIAKVKLEGGRTVEKHERDEMEAVKTYNRLALQWYGDRAFVNEVPA